MATQAQLDAVKALVKAGDFDAARTAFRGEWDELFLNFAMDLSVQGAPPVRLENLTISESWNLQNQDADTFGGLSTHLYGVPTVDLATLVLPVTGVFVPPDGHRFTIRNGSSVNRLLVDPDGAATIDGRSTLTVEPHGCVELLFEGVTGREFGVVSSSSVERVERVPLQASRLTLDAAAAVDLGGGLVGLPATGHGLAASIRVDIAGTTNYDGSFLLDASTSTDQIVIATSFTAETFAGTETVTAALLTWQNPTGATLLVRAVLNITTASSGACTGDFGAAATAVTSDDLLDGADLAVLDVSASPDGTNGRAYRSVASGEFVTGTVASGDPTGLVGAAHIIHHMV